jgi:hypothetical protein
MKRICLVLVLATLAVDASAVGRLADVEIVDRTTGAVLEPHYYRGEYWVAGLPGARYSISIRNQLGERLLAVTAVDGVNVVSGEAAGFQQTGYVFGPHQAYEICGWRKSDQEVASFEFTAPPDSYAGRTGRPANIGIVGVALFRERHPAVALLDAPSPAAPPQRAGSARAQAEAMGADAARAKSAAAAPSSELALTAGSPPPAALVTAPRPALGTGHGAREASAVEHTGFDRLSESPNEVIRIRYDSYANLVAMGVIGTRPPPPPRPNAFPDSPARYVPDPPGYPAGGLR